MVRFEDVRKSFADRSILRGVSFSIRRGEIYGLLGPNGCGKSTTINILCNLLEPDSGTVELAGKPAAQAAMRVIGVCPQQIALYRDLHAAENLRFFAQLYGLSRADAERRVAELISLFGLEAFAQTPVAALSGGWQQRVNIAVGLIHDPAICVLDEPTSAVDLEARHELWKMIDKLKAGGMTMLLTTHHLDEAEQLCSRIGIMDEGRIVREGTVAELLALVPAKAIAMVEAADQAAVLDRAATLGWGTRCYADKPGLLLPQPLSLAEVLQSLEGIEVSAASVRRVSLEHAYLEVLHQAHR